MTIEDRLLRDPPEDLRIEAGKLADTYAARFPALDRKRHVEQIFLEALVNLESMQYREETGSTD